MKTFNLGLTLLLSAVSFAACTEPDTGTASGRVIIEQPCAADADCPTGFECEIEVEHGVTTSYCQSHEDSDGTCPAGYELEVEHGQAYCQPHGGSGGGSDDGSGGGSDDGSGGGSGSGADDGSGGGSGSGSGSGSGGAGPQGATCTTDADCALGLECEIEIEHGVTTATCQPHGGGH